MRASRILSTRPERAIVALAQLCEERKDEELLQPSPPRGAFVPPRLSPLPPQVPYTVDSSPMRPSRLPVADQPEESSPTPSDSQVSPTQHAASPSSLPLSKPPSQSLSAAIPIRLPLDQLEHMAPKRSKWTSPPPPEAPEEDRSAFENRFGQSLALATVASAAQERGQRSTSYGSSSNASETPTDDEVRSDLAESDDVQSIRSFTEEGALDRRREKEREDDREPTVTVERQQLRQMNAGSTHYVQDRPNPRWNKSASRPEGGLDAKMIARLRGRPSLRMSQQSETTDRPPHGHTQGRDSFIPPPRIDSPRRSLSGPARISLPNRFTQLHIPNFIPSPPYLSPADVSSSPQPPPYVSNANVYYETTPVKERLFRVLQPYGVPMSAVPSSSSYQQRFDLPAPTYYDSSGSQNGSPSLSPRHLSPSTRLPSSSPRQTSPRHLPPSLRRNSKLAESSPSSHYNANLLSPTTATYSHSHTNSTATVTSATTPRAHVQHFSTTQALLPSLSRSRSPSHARSHLTSRPHSRQQLPPRLSGDRSMRPASPYASISSGSASPPMSCTSSQYAASCSPLSTSPPSPQVPDAGRIMESKEPSSPKPPSAEVPVRGPGMTVYSAPESADVTGVMDGQDMEQARER